MKISDRILMALRNLSRRKSRTILTVLSVVIGATSIILMLAFATGISNSQKEMIESFGGLTSITIVGDNPAANMDVKDTDINKLKKVKGVRAVVPSKEFWGEVMVDKGDDYVLNTSFEVVPDDVFKLLTSDMFEWGKGLSPSDKDGIVLGQNANVQKIKRMPDGGWTSMPMEGDFDYGSHDYYLRLGYKDESDDGVHFGNENENKDQENKPTFVDVKIKPVGKLNSKAILKGWSSYANETFYKNLKKEDSKLQSPQLDMSYDEKGQPIVAKSDKIKYDNLRVIVDDVNNLERIENDIKKLGYNTQSEVGSAENIKKQTMQVTLILGGIGSVAFIVSAIGIINTMLMSIYERQKEIGVMKVIGASINDIRGMFLIESGFIGFFGGVIGLIISLVVGKVLNGFLDGGMIFDVGGQGGNMIAISPLLAIVGVGFSSLVGVLAGYIPARRATKLSAIEALRSN
ncbi:ABC transporter permease [Anaerococcus degeneri]|uniref:FtsX-like permease family protein n=1 Tax=Anaerococcus degeneri TaxID=361500 RepID=A0ABS7YXQ6_9FIRM|nr:FtsX-like permease family protein [Anaerococcus degeneri]MBP2015543.1 ABC-type antimicrobial peptide transport system permease subunit [Anaerococcus degeneri]MCA2095899.1 FtsX-like permease family protein [Anaerococcus degeneri]